MCLASIMMMESAGIQKDRKLNLHFRFDVRNADWAIDAHLANGLAIMHGKLLAIP